MADGVGFKLGSPCRFKSCLEPPKRRIMKTVSVTLIILGVFISMTDGDWGWFAAVHLIGAIMMAVGGLIALSVLGRE